MYDSIYWGRETALHTLLSHTNCVNLRILAEERYVNKQTNIGHVCYGNVRVKDQTTAINKPTKALKIESLKHSTELILLQIDRQTDRQTGRQADRQTDRQTDRVRERSCFCLFCQSTQSKKLMLLK